VDETKIKGSVQFRTGSVTDRVATGNRLGRPGARGGRGSRVSGREPADSVGHHGCGLVRAAERKLEFRAHFAEVAEQLFLDLRHQRTTETGAGTVRS